MRIGELMQRADVTRDTIRHYEHMGLLHAAHFCKRDNGYRDYNEQAVERVLFVKKAQKAGFTLSQIVQVADEWENNTLPLAEKKQILSKQLAVIDEHIADLQALRAEIEAMLAQDDI